MSLIDDIKINGLSDAQEILKAAGTEDLFEKAHKDGDMHPNGKWVWVSSAAGGKGDWRTLNGRTHKKHQSTTAAGGSGLAAGNSSTTQPTSTAGNKTATASTNQKPKTTNDNFTIDKQRYDVQLKLAQRTINHDGDTANVKVGLSVTQEGIKKLQEKIADLRKNRPGAKKTIKTEEGKLNDLKTNEKAMQDAIKEFESSNKKGSTSNASAANKVVPDSYFIRGNRSSREMDVLYKGMDKKYKAYSKEDLQKLKDTFDKKKTIELAIDRYKRLTKQGASKIAINKEGNLCDELTARYYTIKRLLQAGGNTEPNSKKSNSGSETYSHDINGVTVNVSKNKDGSYTLEANGKKMKSDDPSFFKDKLLPRVKKALAQELGIDMTKKDFSEEDNRSQNSDF